MLFERFRDVCINSMYERRSGWQALIIEWSHIEFSSFTSDSVCMHCVAASLWRKKSQSRWICNVQYEKLSCLKLNLWGLYWDFEKYFALTLLVNRGIEDNYWCENVLRCEWINELLLDMFYICASVSADNDNKIVGICGIKLVP